MIARLAVSFFGTCHLAAAQLASAPGGIDPNSGAYGQGQAVGKFLGIVLLIAVLVIAIVIIKGKMKKKAPPNPQAAFSLDQLKQQPPPPSGKEEKPE